MLSSSYQQNRAREAQSHLEYLARSGDFNAQLHYNLAEAHIIQYETSPERTLRGNAFHNALSSSRALISTLPALRASAPSPEQHRKLDELQQKFDIIRKHCAAYVHVYQSKSAKAVFESVSGFLGIETVLPSRAGKVRTLFGGGRVAVGWKRETTAMQSEQVQKPVQPANNTMPTPSAQQEAMDTPSHGATYIPAVAPPQTEENTSSIPLMVPFELPSLQPNAPSGPVTATSPIATDTSPIVTAESPIATATPPKVKITETPEPANGSPVTTNDVSGMSEPAVQTDTSAEVEVLSSPTLTPRDNTKEKSDTESPTPARATQKSEKRASLPTATPLEPNDSPAQPADRKADMIGPDVPTTMPSPPGKNVSKAEQREKLAPAM